MFQPDKQKSYLARRAYQTFGFVLDPLFGQQLRYAQVLIAGTMLARWLHAVIAILRVTGLSDESHFVNHRRVLQRVAMAQFGSESGFIR